MVTIIVTIVSVCPPHTVLQCGAMCLFATALQLNRFHFLRPASCGLVMGGRAPNRAATLSTMRLQSCRTEKGPRKRQVRSSGYGYALQARQMGIATLCAVPAVPPPCLLASFPPSFERHSSSKGGERERRTKRVSSGIEEGSRPCQDGGDARMRYILSCFVSYSILHMSVLSYTF